MTSRYGRLGSQFTCALLLVNLIVACSFSGWQRRAYYFSVSNAIPLQRSVAQGHIKAYPPRLPDNFRLAAVLRRFIGSVVDIAGYLAAVTNFANAPAFEFYDILQPFLAAGRVVSEAQFDALLAQVNAIANIDNWPDHCTSTAIIYWICHLFYDRKTGRVWIRAYGGQAMGQQKLNIKRFAGKQPGLQGFVLPRAAK